MLYAAGVPNREMMQNAPHVGIATVWYVSNIPREGGLSSLPETLRLHHSLPPNMISFLESDI
jgi:hypothetical protein